MSQETQMLNTIFQDLEFNRECDISTGNRFLAKKGILPEKYSQLKKANLVQERRLILKAGGVYADAYAAFMKMLSVYIFIRFGSVY